jgi:hypothetical protein
MPVVVMPVVVMPVVVMPVVVMPRPGWCDGPPIGLSLGEVAACQGAGRNGGDSKEAVHRILSGWGSWLLLPESEAI